MIEGHPTINLRERGDEKRADHISQDIDGHHEGGEHGTGGMKIDHNVLHSGGEHGGSQGSTVVVLAINTKNVQNGR